MKRLAIISSHPIQYNAPWFALLAASGAVVIKVFYTWEQSAGGEQFDPGFGKHVRWDIPLLDGYDYCFVRNVAADPGTHHFKGIVTPGLNKEVESWKPDFLLVFGWSFLGHFNCLRYFHGKVPVFFRGDSTLLDEQGGVKKLLRRLFLKWVYRFVDIALYVGSNNKDYFLAHGLKMQQLVFAPHAIDNSRFHVDDALLALQAKEWRLRLGFGENDIVVLFAGKLEPKKDPGVLLKLARKMGSERIKFLLVGNGELEKTLKSSAADLPDVVFLDFQNQLLMPVVYRMGDVFILPSKGPGETWGLALNEAMACGLPVVASNKVGGAVDLIEPGRNGFLFEAGNVDDLFDKLSPIMNKDVLLSMGKESLAKITSWSFGHIVDSIICTINK